MNEEILRDLVGQVRDGVLPRRDFIGRMVVLGVGVPLASAMLADEAQAQGGASETRWSSPEYDHAFRLSENELDPVKRAALFVHMNDLACNAGHVVPLAVRAQVTALGKSISAPLTGWDLDLSGIHGWFRA